MRDDEESEVRTESSAPAPSAPAEPAAAPSVEISPTDGAFRDGAASPSAVAAFFDLDKTLVRINTGRLWFAREREEGRLSLAKAIEAGLWAVLYKVGLLAPEIAFGRACRLVAGLAESELVERSLRFFRDVLVPNLAPGARPVIERHREQGERLVLLTSTTPYLAQPMAELLALDDVICTRLEVRDGVMTGELLRPLCYGPGKVELAERWADEAGVDLDASSFYSDSIADLPMLERVGRPVVVHPDVRLRRVALARGWPIEDWTSSDAPPISVAGA